MHARGPGDAPFSHRHRLDSPRRRSSSAGPGTRARTDPGSGGRQGPWTPARTCRRRRPAGIGRHWQAPSPSADPRPPAGSYLVPAGRQTLGEGAEAAPHAAPQDSVRGHDTPAPPTSLGPPLPAPRSRRFRPEPSRRSLVGRRSPRELRLRVAALPSICWALRPSSLEPSDWFHFGLFTEVALQTRLRGRLAGGARPAR